MGKLMERHGIAEPTRRQVRELRRAQGIGMETFRRGTGDDGEEVERIEAAFDTILEFLGIADKVDALPRREADQVLVELTRALFGAPEPAESPCAPSGSGAPTPGDGSTATSAGGQPTAEAPRAPAPPASTDGQP